MTAATAREQLSDLYSAAVAGANVESLTANAVATVPMDRRHRVWVFSIGKAAHAMAGAAVATLRKGLAEVAGGLIVAPEHRDPPSGTIGVAVGDHPVPGKQSFAAAARIARVLTQKRGGDMGVVLLSGGATSLIAAPLRGMQEADLSHLFELLLTSGLPIQEMNAIRKRFSLYAAGRFALALAPARSYCFAVSDVPGDDLASIGSGPCVPDPTNVQKVIELLERTKLLDKIAPTFRQHLADAARGAIPETPKATHPAFAHMNARVIANNGIALTAAAAAARRLGFNAIIRKDALVGDATAAGASVAASLLAMRDSAPNGGMQCCIWGGETTVSVRGAAPRGGRCQELALSAAKHLAQAGGRGDGITVLAAGTDGRDGTTDAAGAVVDASTWTTISSNGRDPSAALLGHESHEALAAANALFAPGVTGTNVMDVTIGLVRT